MEGDVFENEILAQKADNVTNYEEVTSVLKTKESEKFVEMVKVTSQPTIVCSR